MLSSPFANLYIEIVQRLKTTVPMLKYIEQDLGQLEHYDIRPAVTYPCCLIDVGENFTFSDETNNVQFATGSVSLRIAVVRYSDSNNLVPDNIRENALQYFEIEHKIFKALQGWQPQGFSRMQRIQVATEKREDDIRVRVMPFSISFTDTSANDGKYQTIPRPAMALAADIVLKVDEAN